MPASRVATIPDVGRRQRHRLVPARSEGPGATLRAEIRCLPAIETIGRRAADESLLDVLVRACRARLEPAGTLAPRPPDRLLMTFPGPADVAHVLAVADGLLALVAQFDASNRRSVPRLTIDIWFTDT
jgi:hypothetical protein